MTTNQVGCELRITPKAAKEFISMCTDEEKDLKESYLRVGANSGGCSGWKYSLDYEDTANPTDLIFEQFGVKLIVDEYILTDIIGDVEVDIDSSNIRIRFQNTQGSTVNLAGSIHAVCHP